MAEDINQKLIDEIITLSKTSTHRLRERTLTLIDLYKNQRKQNEKIIKNHTAFLKQIDKRTLAVNATNSKKDKMLAQQSKMAAMGEMMDAVAHQWKQPLNSLSMINDMLKDDFANGLVDDAYIAEINEVTHLQINHMVNTLSEFRTFFRPCTDTEDFHLTTCLNSVQVLMKDELITNNINIFLEIETDITVHGLINEFKHLFLNLLSNAIDSFNEKRVSQRNIYIKSFIKDEKMYITFEDNAGGIPRSVINDIFKPNVTTKKKGKGTGIGLYMSKQIVQKHHGKISVENTDMGALFTITLR